MKKIEDYVNDGMITSKKIYEKVKTNLSTQKKSKNKGNNFLIELKLHKTFQIYW